MMMMPAHGGDFSSSGVPANGKAAGFACPHACRVRRADPRDLSPRQHLLTDFAYHRRPRGVVIPRAFRASAI